MKSAPTLIVLILLEHLVLFPSQTHAQSGKVLTLDGAGDWVDIPASALEPLFQNRPFAATLEVWFRFEKGGTVNPRIVHSENSFQLFVSPIADTTTLIANVAFKTDQERITAGIQSLKWYHATLELDDETMHFFLNGREIGTGVHISGTPPADSLSFNLRLGANAFNSSDNFKGEIDELRLWNRVLSGEEIRANMNRQLTGKETGLVGYWTFDSVDAQGNVPDLSGRGNRGELRGNAHLVDVPYRILPDLDPSESYQGKTERCNISKGDTVRLQLFAQNFPRITGYGFLIDFDPTKVTYIDKSFTSGTFLSDGQQLASSTNGQLEAGVVSFSGTIGSGNGFLGQMDFQVQDTLYDATEITVSSLGFTLEDDRLQEQSVHESVRLCSRLPGDFNGDNIVGFQDFLLFAVGFRKNDPDYDLNGDGTVGFADFLIFVEVFGTSRNPPLN